MKRILVLLLMLPILLCGCAKQQSFTPLLHGISFVTDIKYQSEIYVCDCKIDKNAVLTVQLTSPEELNGLKTVYNEGNVSVSFKDLECDTVTDSNTAADILYICIADVLNGKCDTKSDENITVSGRTDGFSYSFLFAPSGLPIKLESDDGNYLCEFKKIALLY